MKDPGKNCPEVPPADYRGCLANGGFKKDIEIVENPLDGATSTPKVLLLRSNQGNQPSSKFITAGILGVLIIAIFVVGLVLYSVRGCNSGSPTNVCITENCVRTAASLLSAMDLSANPCDDFFQFACGSWNREHQIPEDRSSISVFEVLSDKLQLILRGVLEEPFNSEDNDATKKAKRFYMSCMDKKKIRADGDKPLKKAVSDLGGWPVVDGDSWSKPGRIEEILATLKGLYNEGVLIDVNIGPDDKNSTVNIVQFEQMALALPSKDYYIKSNSESDYLSAYHKFVTDVALLMGANSSIAAVELLEVVLFEKKLADVSLSEVDKHDANANYNKITIKKLQELVPQFDWLLYLRILLKDSIDENETVVVYGINYFLHLGKILTETNSRVIYNYILWRFVMTMTPHMLDDYQAKHTEFRRILQGIQIERTRWSQCVEWTNKKIGMAVGSLYIKENFNQGSKKIALEMIQTIRDAFNELLEENNWMDNETRAVAKEKANLITENIGYPEYLTNAEKLNKEYLLLNITENQFMENVFNILHYDAVRNFNAFRQPADKYKWPAEPAVVNAFYNPNNNAIVFPAGILQPLFYSQHFPKSLNYGGIGVVIGHEITHGFDDKGRQFDKDGNMMQWWNNATINKFRERSQCFIDQYNRYKLELVDQFINGRMTQGENMADNGGLKQSFRAYKKWVAQNGEEPLLPGISLGHDQLFFLNYAQIWCGTMRPEDALSKIRSAVHSPGPIRVIGPLSNFAEFSKAFNCPLGSPMNPSSKCSVW